MNISPHLHVFGFLPRGPLAILRESWLGERVLPSLNVSAEKYLADLREKLATVSEYALNHSEIQKDR